MRIFSCAVLWARRNINTEVPTIATAVLPYIRQKKEWWCPFIIFLVKSCRLYTSSYSKLSPHEETLGCQNSVWVKGRFFPTFVSRPPDSFLIQGTGGKKVRREGRCTVYVRYLVSAYISLLTLNPKPTSFPPLAMVLSRRADGWCKPIFVAQVYPPRRERLWLGAVV